MLVGHQNVRGSREVETGFDERSSELPPSATSKLETRQLLSISPAPIGARHLGPVTAK
jgi:hypothetical protein